MRGERGRIGREGISVRRFVLREAGATALRNGSKSRGICRANSERERLGGKKGSSAFGATASRIQSISASQFVKWAASTGVSRKKCKSEAICRTRSERGRVAKRDERFAKREQTDGDLSPGEGSSVFREKRESAHGDSFREKRARAYRGKRADQGRFVARRTGASVS